MATLTVFKYNTSDGAEKTLSTLESLSKQQLIEVYDAAIVEWKEGKKKPKTRQLYNLIGERAGWGALWGLLFGMIFFVPSGTGKVLDVKNQYCPSGDMVGRNTSPNSVNSSWISGFVHRPFFNLVLKIAPRWYSSSPYRSKIHSFPSGVKTHTNSLYLSNDTIPGANTSGVIPGGFCPRYGPVKVGKLCSSALAKVANSINIRITK